VRENTATRRCTGLSRQHATCTWCHVSTRRLHRIGAGSSRRYTGHSARPLCEHLSMVHKVDIVSGSQVQVASPFLLPILSLYVTHTQPFYSSLDFVQDNVGELVPEETFNHSHLSVIPCLLPMSITIHGILPVHLFNLRA